jgi:hypothetical protein
MPSHPCDSNKSNGIYLESQLDRPNKIRDAAPRRAAQNMVLILLTWKKHYIKDTTMAAPNSGLDCVNIVYQCLRRPEFYSDRNSDQSSGFQFGFRFLIIPAQNRFPVPDDRNFWFPATGIPAGNTNYVNMSSKD